MIKMNIQKGFSLLEVAIVLLILGFVLGGLMMPMSAQRENNNIKQARQEIKSIQQALYGFAIANTRLPCPAQPGLGTESPLGGGVCNNNSIGFVPSASLGIDGDVNCDGLLLDPWGNPYRYSVTTNDQVPVGSPDFTTAGEINNVGAATLNPDLRICTDSTCAANLTNDAVAVIYSMGGNWSNVVSNDEIQNGGEGAPIPSGCTADYGVSNDNDYVSRARVEIAGSEYDDIVSWISANILYAKLLAAGVL